MSKGKDHFFVTMQDHSYKGSISSVACLSTSSFQKVFIYLYWQSSIPRGYGIGDIFNSRFCSCSDVDTCFISGSRDDANQLIEVTNDKNGKLVLLHHIQPSCFYVTGMQELLDQTLPII